jgi:hypothetical protein
MPKEAWPWVEAILDEEFTDHNIAAIISGGARGVDRMVERYVWKLPCPWTGDGRWIVARELPGFNLDYDVARGLMLVVMPNYSKHGKHAPLVRNTVIAETCTRLIALVRGTMTSGTGHVTGEAARLGKPVTVHTWAGG